MKSTHIVVNARMLQKNRLDGIGWFAYQTLRRIAQAHPEIKFTFLFDRPFNPEFIFGPNVTGRIVLPPVRHPILYYIWYQIQVKKILRALKPDLFLSPDGLLPLGANCPQLAVIHDINFVHHPLALPLGLRIFFNFYFPKYAQAATRLATVSKYSQQDIATQYRVPLSKIDVVYNGLNDGFTPCSETTKQQIRHAFTEGQEYFIFVGSLHPRKNVERLIQAFEIFKTKTKSPIKLVCVGPKFWGQNNINKELRKTSHASDIIFTGRIDDKRLHQLMGAALALTYVPIFEGFGIPLLEAMKAEIPIITSNTTSLPEVAGEAALYVNPLSVSDISAAMSRLYQDVELREILVARGKMQVKKFSWDKTADAMWHSIQTVLATTKVGI